MDNIYLSPGPFSDSSALRLSDPSIVRPFGWRSANGRGLAGGRRQAGEPNGIILPLPSGAAMNGWGQPIVAKDNHI